MMYAAVPAQLVHCLVCMIILLEVVCKRLLCPTATVVFCSMNVVPILDAELDVKNNIKATIHDGNRGTGEVLWLEYVLSWFMRRF